MQLLDILLLVKIAVTMVFVALPYLCLTDRQIAHVLGEPPKDRPLQRLYATALLALCVAYASGLSWWRADDFPTGIVLMGLVSNGGATALLLLDQHTRIERLSALFFGSVTIALALAWVFPELATQPL